MKKTTMDAGVVPVAGIYVPHFEMVLLKPVGKTAQWKVGAYEN
jgi:hypothetical protein